MRFARVGLVQGKKGGFQASRQEIEWFFGLCCLVPRAATATAFRPLRVEFSSPGPDDVSEHVRVFGCPVSFRERANRAWFDAQVWELPSNHANAELLRIVEAYATRATMPPFESTGEAVRRLVRAQLEAGPLELDQIARQLAMSARTLQRRLSAEGASFARVVENTRDDCAREFLRATKLSIVEIAQLLGFSEQSAFTRAFKSWTGTTPAQFRRQISDIEQGRRGVSVERAAAWAKLLGYHEGQFVQLALQAQLDGAGIKLRVDVHAA